MRRGGALLSAIGLACGALVFSACVPVAPPPPPPAPPLSHGPTIPADSTQAITVIAGNGWGATTGILYFDTRAPGGPWQWTGASALVDFGPTGLGWGPGLQYGGQGPQKREGDGRSPAGVFRLGSAFGYAPFGTAMPYLQSGPQHVCVDDSNSSHYNQIVDTNATGRDWNSAEPMLRPDNLYQIGVVINENPARTPNMGSCVFLHVWRGYGASTAGCTSTAINVVHDLLTWLDPAQDPVVIQMPVGDYRTIEGDWGLPAR